MGKAADKAFEIKWKEEQASARLARAAPKLLAALKEAEVVLIEQRRGLCPDIDKALARVAKAIAEAEGTEAKL